MNITIKIINFNISDATVMVVLWVKKEEPSPRMDQVFNIIIVDIITIVNIITITIIIITIIIIIMICEQQGESLPVSQSLPVQQELGATGNYTIIFNI